VSTHLNSVVCVVCTVLFFGRINCGELVLDLVTLLVDELDGFGIYESM
jgi:hypothetical protein